MIRAGMNVARINFSHGDPETHKQAVDLIRRVAEEEATVVAVMCDLQGPKIRLGKIANEPIEVHKGDQLTLTTDPADGSNMVFPLPHPEFVKDVKVGNRLLLDDGELEFRVIGKQGNNLRCEVVVGGPLMSNKGVSAPDAKLTLLSLTEKDRKDVELAIQMQADYLAMSFVRRGSDMTELRWLVRHLNGDMLLIAKIEKREALENFDEILVASDGIMVARGDLGVESPAEEVPIHQKAIIRRCNECGVPVITATQMLNSMITNPRPTRAEASDVANAIFDGTDAIMLSAETASGSYPVEAVETMANIARIAEANLTKDAAYVFGNTSRDEMNLERISEATSHAATQIAEELGAKLIVTSTWTGYTARAVARHRPVTPILGVTPQRSTYRRMALIWGVQPVMIPEIRTIDEIIDQAVKTAQDMKLVDVNDVLIVISGQPQAGGGQTNFLKVHQVAETEEAVDHTASQ